MYYLLEALYCIQHYTDSAGFRRVFSPLTEDIIFIAFRERGSEGNIDVREKHPWVASGRCQGQDQIHNLGMCPDRESNLQPFDCKTMLQPTKPHQPGGEKFYHKEFLMIQGIHSFQEGCLKFKTEVCVYVISLSRGYIQ